MMLAVSLNDYRQRIKDAVERYAFVADANELQRFSGELGEELARRLEAA